jgi:hypothetical protein
MFMLVKVYIMKALNGQKENPAKNGSRKKKPDLPPLGGGTT